MRNSLIAGTIVALWPRYKQLTIFFTGQELEEFPCRAGPGITAIKAINFIPNQEEIFRWREPLTSYSTFRTFLSGSGSCSYS